MEIVCVGPESCTLELLGLEQWSRSLPWAKSSLVQKRVLGELQAKQSQE